MQENVLEVTFCDLCGTSVPVADLSSSAALRHNGKLVGACCLLALRAGSGGTATIDASRAAGAPLLPVAIVLLAAIATATIFLDQKILGLDTLGRAAHDQVRQAQRSDSDVLQALDVGMDSIARKADLDVLVGKLALFEISLQQANDQARQRAESSRLDLETVRQEVRNVAAASIDYRPLFDDMRQKQQRLAEAVMARPPAAEAVPPTGGETAGPPEPTPPVADPEALPPALAEQAKKLMATDPAVRFEAVDELLRSKNALVLAHLIPLARDPDAFVRRLTVDGLRDFKRPEAVEALLVAMTDTDENVRDTAWRSLKEVTGQKLPFDTHATKDSRARAAQRWQEWWDKNKDGFGT